MTIRTFFTPLSQGSAFYRQLTINLLLLLLHNSKTTDGPALKEADVGFALGKAGTEIAKEACDIVILDDNIKSMTKAVLWGRNVYISIRKFLQFQLVVNVVAVLLNFISACAGVSLPLGAVPLLWVNMIMDSMGALALATEPPRPELLKRKPFGRTAPLINRQMYRNIIGISLYQLAVCLVLQFAGERIFNLDDYCQDLSKGDEDRECDKEQLELLNSSIIFNVFVFMQVFSEINSRCIGDQNVFRGIHKSVMFLVIIAITIGVQVALMLGVGGTSVGRSIGIDEINAAAWGTSLVLGALVLPWGFIVRWIPLDWFIGALDEDPTNRSKLERLLGLGKKRGVITNEDKEEDSEYEFSKQLSGTCETDATSRESPPDIPTHGMGARTPTPPLMQFRVFVHAVAFVNVMSRQCSSRSAESTTPDDDDDSA